MVKWVIHHPELVKWVFHHSRLSTREASTHLACLSLYMSRSQRGQVVASYNDHLRPAAAGGVSGGAGIKGAPGASAAAPGVVLVELGEPLGRDRHRYMMETLDTKVGVAACSDGSINLWQGCRKQPQRGRRVPVTGARCN